MKRIIQSPKGCQLGRVSFQKTVLLVDEVITVRYPSLEPRVAGHKRSSLKSRDDCFHVVFNMGQGGGIGTCKLCEPDFLVVPMVHGLQEPHVVVSAASVAVDAHEVDLTAAASFEEVI